MKFSKIDLLTLLISLFLFASCENTSTIGLEIDPGKAVQGDLTDSLTVTSRTIKDDVTNTRNLIRHPLGFLTDPIFGTTEASLAMSVGIPSTSYSFGNVTSLDSAILVLNYSGEFYGDSTLTYSIDVRQLHLNLDDNETFPNTKDYTSGPVIGNRTGRLFPTTKIKVTDIVTGKKDTLKSVSPQIRIKLSNAFIQENLIDAGDGILKNDFNFMNAFRGFKVQINKAGSTGNGGIMFLDFATVNSNLQIYYKKVGTTNPIDTIHTIFGIGSEAYPVAATITHNYTGTPIETQLNNPNQQFPVTYLQPLVGLRNKISFPYIDKFAEEVGKIVVNKAELVIDVSSGTDLRPFDAAPRLSLYRYDIAEQRVNLPDNNPTGDKRGLSPAVFGGYFDSVKKRYVFVVTAYIQDLIAKKTKDYGTFLAPTSSNEFQTMPSLISAARSVIAAGKKNATVDEKALKLNIYYTKVK